MAKKKRKPHVSSSLEGKFLGLWRLLAEGWPEPVVEYRFVLDEHTQGRTRYVTQTKRVRTWRFDFAWPEQLVAVEMEGGVFTGGAHTRGRDYDADTQKYNASVALGWRVLRYTVAAIDERPMQMVEEIKGVLKEIQCES